AALVPAADELKEQVGALPIDGQVADLVDDEQAGHRVELELVVEPALPEGPRERADERSGRGEQHAVAVFDGPEAEPPGGRLLAPAGRNRPILPSFGDRPPSTIPGPRSSARR